MSTPSPIPYLPNFDRYSLPPLSPTNPQPYNVIDCGLALSDTSSRYFPVMKHGLTSTDMKEYYFPFDSPTQILTQYYQQCCKYKSEYESIKRDEYLHRQRHKVSDHIDQKNDQNHEILQIKSLPSPVFTNPSTSQISQPDTQPTASSSLTSLPQKGSILKDNEPLPHEVGIWQLRSKNDNEKIQIEPFSEAIQAEKLSKRRGLTLQPQYKYKKH